jgi:hypothetical protein
MPDLTSPRLAAVGALFAGAGFAAAGALQATGLHWKENAVQTPLQHLTMALIALALVAAVPTVACLGRLCGGRARHGWIGVAVGSVVVAGASTVSNIRGVDASWFPAVAVAANMLWIVGTFALAFGLYLARRVPRLVAIGVVVAYLGAIPFGSQGGGLITGSYWLAVAYCSPSARSSAEPSNPPPPNRQKGSDQ